MSITPQVKSSFPKFDLKRSSSGERVLTYEKSKCANNLFKFISSHPAIRASFNSMVKADFASLEKATSYLPNFLKQSETSLLYEAKCSCEQILERPHIYNLQKTKFPKSITCINCKKVNNLMIGDYSPYYDIDLKDLLKVFYLGDKSVFTISPIKECFKCGTQTVESSNKLSLKCKDCSKLAYISMQVFPNKEIKELLKDRQGYWLEWYIWRLLRDKYAVEIGITINKKYEADLIVIHNNNRIFIECKDTSDSALMSLHEIKKDFDYFIFVTTCNYKNAHLDNAKKILKKKFYYVTPNRIEKISEIIGELNNELKVI